MARSAFIVVPLALGCAAEAETPAAPPPAPAPVVHTARPALPPSGETLNWRDPDHGSIYRGPEGCFVYLPFPEPPTSVVPPPSQAVPCPPAMLQPAWNTCLHGTLSRAAEGCSCAQFSNPPPPPRLQPCPT